MNIITFTNTVYLLILVKKKKKSHVDNFFNFLKYSTSVFFRLMYKYFIKSMGWVVIYQNFTSEILGTNQVDKPTITKIW